MGEEFSSRMCPWRDDLERFGWGLVEVASSTTLQEMEKSLAELCVSMCAPAFTRRPFAIAMQGDTADVCRHLQGLEVPCASPSHEEPLDRLLSAYFKIQQLNDTHTPSEAISSILSLAAEIAEYDPALGEAAEAVRRGEVLSNLPSPPPPQRESRCEHAAAREHAPSGETSSVTAAVSRVIAAQFARFIF